MKFKERMMNSMMDKQFGNMSNKEKSEMMNSMMDKFFSNMSEEEKQNMMSEMMPKMMGNMMCEGGMMKMMGGRKHHGHNHHGSKHDKEECCKKTDQGHDKHQHHFKSPMEMCMHMMRNMSESAQTARFATPELRLLFDEWCQQIEKEILAHSKETGSIKVGELSQKFGLTEESIKYLLSCMAKAGKIDFKSSNIDEN